MDFSEATYNQYQVACEHPRIIINPLLPELLAKFDDYVLRGNYVHKLHNLKHLFSFDYKTFSVKRNNIVREDIPSSYVIDRITGETFPIYMEVPCNKCHICKERKVNSFVQRCKFETQVYDNKPWFCTLTFDDEHLPAKGASVDDAQRFLKRFRINLYRAGYKERIRYVLVSEYGKNTHRSHMHAIFWNINAKDHKQYLEVSNILQKSWNLGFVQRRLINPADDKAFFYTSKYLKKDCVVPEGCNPPFMLSSRGNGGIGSRFIDNIANEVRRTLNVSYKFLNKWSNKVEEVVFSQYVLNRIFPSWCKAVPSALRRDLADFSLGYSRLKDFSNLFTNQIQQDYDDFNKYFSSYCVFGTFRLFSLPVDVRPSVNEALQICGECAARIRLYIGKINFAEVQKIADKRGLFCSKLFEHVKHTDIGARAFNARRKFGLSAATEIF